MPQHAIATPDQQPNGGVILLPPLPAPPVEKGSGDSATAEPQKAVYRE
jgi:hypothetical protein